MRTIRSTALLFAATAALSACAIYHSKPNLPDRSQVAAGQTITVEGSQNVYAVAREHNVSMRDIIVLNGLQPPYNLHPGQTLTLPAGGSMSSGGYSSSSASFNSGGNFKQGYAPSPASSPSGDIQAETLPPLDVKPIQSTPLAPPPKTPNNLSQAPIAPAPVATASVALPAAQKPKTQVDALNKPAEAPKPVATTANNIAKPEPTPPLEPAATADVPEPSSAMIWPVKGPILSGFGPKGQGLNNDGINIGAPKGAPVVSAGNGIVVYAGNEMKGFGNLVLIRHKDGWVTAYAHLDRMLVQKDGVVAQGDEIGTVGKTGNVPSPQLHFETRYEGKPVDPSTVIKAH